MRNNVKTRTFWHAHNEDSNQSDQSLRSPHEETLYSWLSKMHPVKILIRLHECAGWSESSLGPHARRDSFWHCGLYHCNSKDYFWSVLSLHENKIVHMVLTFSQSLQSFTFFSPTIIAFLGIHISCQNCTFHFVSYNKTLLLFIAFSFFFLIGVIKLLRHVE